jgi:uncharacterized protein
VIEGYADRWALVTGASSGIGAEFARQLAARGMHLILVARREDRLQELAEELDTRHGTQCEVIVADLSNPEEAGRLFKDISSRNIDVELLINNAGFGFVGAVDDTDPQRMMAMINVASIAAFQPVAYMPVYSASKAFVLHFSEALWAECRDRNVTIQGLCPGTTATEFFDVAGASGWLKKQRSHTVAYVVRKSIKGLDRGRQYVVPGFLNLVLSLSVRLARRKMVVLQSMRFFRPQPKKGRADDQTSDK